MSYHSEPEQSWQGNCQREVTWEKNNKASQNIVKQKAGQVGRRLPNQNLIGCLASKGTTQRELSTIKWFFNFVASIIIVMDIKNYESVNWPPSEIVTYLNRGFSCDMGNQEIHCKVFTVRVLVYFISYDLWHPMRVQISIVLSGIQH